MGKLILNGKEYLGDGVKDVKVNGTSVVIDRVAEVTAVQDNPTFTEASTRANIVSGESFATILGKIKKFFTDLKTVAFTGAYSDLSGTENVAVKNANNRFSQSQIIDAKNGTVSTDGYSYISVGNGTPSGTSGNSFGIVEIYGKGSKYVDLKASNVTANRNIEFPDKNGTVALTSDIPDISTKVSKSGDTMTGNLYIQKAGETFVNAKNTNTSVIVYLDSDGDGTHGIWSSGYNDGTYHGSGRWILRRSTNGDVYVNDTKVPYNGGTLALTKEVVLCKTDGGIGAVGGNGTDGYALIAEIKPNEQYQNRPIYFEVSGRNTIFVTLTLRFTNSTSTDPGLDIFTANTSGTSRFRIFKTATSTWQLYYYLGGWDTITLHRISGQQSNICTPKMTWVSASNLPVTWENGQVPTPDTYVGSTTVNYGSTGNIALVDGPTSGKAFVSFGSIPPANATFVCITKNIGTKWQINVGGLTSGQSVTVNYLIVNQN